MTDSHSNDEAKPSDNLDTTFEADTVESGEPRRLTLREQANAPSDTVGMGSYAALSCSIMAVLVTGLLIAGLLLFRWIF
jgi:hypothetical protein